MHTRLLNQWPGGDPYLFTALALAVLFVPLPLLEGVGAIALMRLLPWLFLVAWGAAPLMPAACRWPAAIPWR